MEKIVKNPTGGKGHEDRRPVSWGVSRLLMLAMVVVSVWIAVKELLLFRISPSFGYSLCNLIAAVIFIVATAGVIHNGRKMSFIASLMLVVEMLLFGFFAIFPAHDPMGHLLTNASQAYLYIPFFLVVMVIVFKGWTFFSLKSARFSKPEKPMK